MSFGTGACSTNLCTPTRVVTTLCLCYHLENMASMSPQHPLLSGVRAATVPGFQASGRTRNKSEKGQS